MKDRLGVPEPTGAWDIAIRNLRQAYELMEEMNIDSHHGVDSLGNVFRRQIEAMIGAVDQHWRQAWWKTATTPARRHHPRRWHDRAAAVTVAHQVKHGLGYPSHVNVYDADGNNLVFVTTVIHDSCATSAR